MASIEFIQKRIAGKEAEIAKLEKKLARIRKVEAQGWADPNPYYYHESDLKYCLRDFDNAQKSLESYQAELQVMIEKENSRNIQVILDFLEGWKAQVKQFYEKSLPKWLEARQAYYDANHAYCEEYNYGDWKRTGDKTKLNELHEIEKAMECRFNNWNFLNPYVQGYKDVSLNWDRIQKDLDYEAASKYDFIIERTNKIVGQITDASYLEIGEKGDLNGIIYGTKGAASVQTIGAGGYNIQCFHFRTLINKVK